MDEHLAKNRNSAKGKGDDYSFRLFFTFSIAFILKFVFYLFSYCAHYIMVTAKRKSLIQWGETSFCFGDLCVAAIVQRVLPPLLCS